MKIWIGYFNTDVVAFSSKKAVVKWLAEQVVDYLDDDIDSISNHLYIEINSAIQEKDYKKAINLFTDYMENDVSPIVFWVQEVELDKV